MAAFLFASLAPAVADEQRTFRGNVLPFEIITAIRNYGFKDGPAAMVSVSVDGGNTGDWLATATYVAEQSIVGDVTFATVDVFVKSPWGDLPPQGVKRLAKAYFSGPDPSKSPWPDEPWSLTAAGHAPSLPDVEYVELQEKLTSQSDPGNESDEAEARREEKGRVMIVRKYHLPASWKPDEHLGSLDFETVQATREQITVVDTQAAAASIAGLKDCLSQSGTTLFRGCQDRSENYAFDR